MIIKFSYDPIHKGRCCVYDCLLDWQIDMGILITLLRTPNILPIRISTPFIMNLCKEKWAKEVKSYNIIANN